MTLWIKTLDPTVEPFDLEVVSTPVEASVLTDHQAQQIARAASVLYSNYAWVVARVADGFLVAGRIK